MRDDPRILAKLAGLPPVPGEGALRTYLAPAYGNEIHIAVRYPVEGEAGVVYELRAGATAWRCTMWRHSPT